MDHPHITAIVILSRLLPILATAAAAPVSAAQCSNNTDLAALLAFRSQLSDPLGVLASNWTTEVSFCHWTGISCSQRRQRVIALELPGVSLRGELTPHLGNLSFLHVLNLTDTDLVGSVPDDLGRLTRLLILDLGNNSLSGTVASTIGNLTRLQVLALNSNQLYGKIPNELLSLHNLRYISLTANYLSGPTPNFSSTATPSLTHIQIHRNSITGSIPHGFGSLLMLQELVLRYNLFTGPAPPNIFNMSRLRIMSIGMNNLEGPIPGNQSFKLPMLQLIDLYGNKFTGPIPSGLAACKRLQILQIPLNLFVDVIPTWLGQLSQLTAIAMGGNYIFGPIPGALSNLTMLRFLGIVYSNVTGQIPEELGKMAALTEIHLGFNQLTGPFPVFFGNLSGLTKLDIRSNHLSKPVPPSAFGNISSLQYLAMDSNNFSGNLDFLASLSNCRQLQDLYISNNPFTSAILNPNHVGNLSNNLLIFEAMNNHITGGLPATLSNLSALHSINLKKNQLNGPIPESIAAMESLDELVLSLNSISGSVPETIGMLRGLVSLFLDNNKISGSIPDGLANLTMLQHIDLSYNDLSSSSSTILFHLDNIVTLYISNNFLNGSLPSDLSYMHNVDQVDLSNNRLIGTLPNSFAIHQTLTYLNLSHNSFKDSIPDSFCQLTNLVTLDLSSNSLSGTIPDCLANISYLASLNLSFNNLEGQIPNGGVFSNLNSQALIGNVRLCGGDPSLGFSPCIVRLHTTHGRHFLKFLLPVVIAVALGFTMVFLYQMRKKKIEYDLDAEVSIDMAHVVNHRPVSTQQIVRATDSFNQDNLLGAGSFGKVFKGQLDDGMVVAIKVLNMEMAHAKQSFNAECKALRMARHRNLIRIYSICCSSNFRALLLEYMPNGSLEEHLHTDRRPYIGFLEMLDIMLDVSMAMEYLHHGHYEVILHCDLKPSNVLFDEGMTAHVADFGIAKLLLGDGSSMVSVSMPGTMGYIAPEYALLGRASRKSDVFSFGIMLLEAFTGKRPTDPMFVGSLSLRQWVSEAYPTRLVDIAYHKLLQDEKTIISFDQQPNFLASIFELGLICSSELPEQRMTMNNVVVKLNDIKEGVARPTRTVTTDGAGQKRPVRGAPSPLAGPTACPRVAWGAAHEGEAGG